MVFDLSKEYPIIAVDEAKMLGYMQGVVIQDDRLIGVLCVIKEEYLLNPCIADNVAEKYIQIPVENVAMGPNAMMLKKLSMANTLFTHGRAIYRGMPMYTCEGQYIGKVTAIDIKNGYFIDGLHTEEDYIKASRIAQIGNVIIIDADCEQKEHNTFVENDESPTEVRVKKDGNVKEQQRENREYTAEIHDIEAADVGKLMEPVEAESEDSILRIIDSRYKYLLGKKLVNAITIAGQSYPDGTTINIELMEASIKNNCILSVIMNAED